MRRAAINTRILMFVETPHPCLAVFPASRLRCDFCCASVLQACSVDMRSQGPKIHRQQWGRHGTLLLLHCNMVRIKAERQRDAWYLVRLLLRPDGVYRVLAASTREKRMRSLQREVIIVSTEAGDVVCAHHVRNKQRLWECGRA